MTQCPYTNVVSVQFRPPPPSFRHPPHINLHLSPLRPHPLVSSPVLLHTPLGKRRPSRCDTFPSLDTTASSDKNKNIIANTWFPAPALQKAAYLPSWSKRAGSTLSNLIANVEIHGSLRWLCAQLGALPSKGVSHFLEGYVKVGRGYGRVSGRWEYEIEICFGHAMI